MRSLLTLGFFLAAISFAQADDAADAAKKLEGTYSLSSGIVAGQKDAEKLKEITAVHIKDGIISIKTPNRTDAAKYTVDATKTPAELNLSTVKGNSTLLGIYEAKETPDGLQLRIAFSPETGARPKDFKGEAADSVVLVLLRQAAKK